MKTKQRTVRRKKPYGPNIVRAWFDTVFHYALRGLENERDFLVRRNWTYRFRKRSLEYLGPVAEHLPAEARENLEQLISFFPEVSAAIEEHDKRERQLQDNCRAYMDAILKDSSFQKAFESVASEAPHTLGRQFGEHFGAYSAEEDFMGLLAEYLVNNVENLPSQYATAELWNRYRESFLTSVSTSELNSFREAVERSGVALFDAVNELTSLLRTTRSDLSLEFDVPYVAELSSVR